MFYMVVSKFKTLFALIFFEKQAKKEFKPDLKKYLNNNNNFE